MRQQSYDQWLERMLRQLDQVLTWAQENGTRIVVDLHSPPGGEKSALGYQGANGELFSNPAEQEHFIKVWELIANRYKGRPEIWAYELANEPDDSGTTDNNCLDWPDLAMKTGLAIRLIDPERTLIVQSAKSGFPDGFKFMRPLALANVVYSFHIYLPEEFALQNVGSHVVYPGMIGGRYWNKETLVQAMEPAISFAKKYRVQMYVGEFSVIRWAPAPGTAQYLADLVDIFESLGWDWSYHHYWNSGWDGWSLEHGSDPDNHNTVGMTDRQKIIRDAFAKNVFSKY